MRYSSRPDPSSSSTSRFKSADSSTSTSNSINRNLFHANSPFDAASAPNDVPSLPSSLVRAPPIDIYDTPESFRINVALPGVPPENINIDFQHRTHELVISGNVPWEVPFDGASLVTTTSTSNNEESEQPSVPEAERNDAFYKTEYLKVNECWPTGGLFSRRIKFPVDSKVNGSGVTADLKFGVVYIRVPKM